MFLGWNRWGLNVGVEEKIVNKGKENEYVKYLGVEDVAVERAKEKLKEDKKNKKKKEYESRPRCSAYTKGGKKCKNKALKGKTKCYAHD